MIGLNQWNAYVTAKREAERRGHIVPISSEQRADAIRAQSVLDHPGWRLLQHHMDQSRQQAEYRIARLRADLGEANLTDQEIRWHQLELRDLQGFVRALNDVSTMIPDLIARGTETTDASRPAS